jgi:hypothetical protein
MSLIYRDETATVHETAVIEIAPDYRYYTCVNFGQLSN